MGTPYVEQPQNVFNYATDWYEHIGDPEQSGGGRFAQDQQEYSCRGYVPWNKLRSAIAYFVGYSYSDQGYPWRLHRVNPSPNPIFPSLYCYDVSYVGTNVKPNSSNPQSQAYLNSPFYATPDQLRSTQYGWAAVTLRYKSYNYLFLPDSEIETSADEWSRSCFIGGNPKLDVLSADGISQLAWAETGPGGKGPKVGTSFTAPIAELLGKQDYIIDWKGVDFDYLSEDPDIFYPTKIINGLGLVNSEDFIITSSGVPFFPAGTALLRGIEYKVYPFPIASSVPSSPLLGVDVRMSVEYFNPKLGASSPIGRGHNAMPWRGAPGDPTGGQFFWATRGGGPSDPPFLGSYNYNNFFYHIDAPLL